MPDWLMLMCLSEDMYDTHPESQPSIFLHHSIIKTKGRAMEVVTHFVNDTVEFYKWSLTIAGESSLFWGLDQVTFHHSWKRLSFYSCLHIYILMKSTFLPLQTKGWRTGQWCLVPSPHWPSAACTCSSCGRGLDTCRTASPTHSGKPS